MLQKQKKDPFVFTNFRRVKQKQVVKVIFFVEKFHRYLTFGDSGINEISVNKSGLDQFGDYAADDDKSKDGDFAVTMTNENKLKALYRSLS